MISLAVGDGHRSKRLLQSSYLITIGACGVARLEYIDNSGDKSVLDLTEGESISIGRNPGSSIQTNNPSVSRNHGRIFVKAGSWVVKDLGSSNGTYINDEKIQQSELRPDDRIRCGDFVIHFFAQIAAPSRKKKKKAPAKADPFAFDDASFDEKLDEPKKPKPKDEAERPLRMNATEAKIPRPPVRPTIVPRQGSRPADLDDVSAAKEERRSAREERDRDRRTDSRSSREPERAERPERSSRDERPERKSGRGGAKERRAEREAVEADKELREKAKRHLAQINEQAEEIDQIGADLKEHRRMVSDLELKLEEMEGRAIRYEVELDSITEKYVQLKDQLTISRERLDEAREELAEKDDRAFQLESRISELDTELDSARGRATDSQEATTSFKIKLTQKDRQIEELQRQYDLLEFEFRAVKEQLDDIIDGRNHQAGDAAKLERKLNNLREIISDKENVISELRLEAENKDIEIRQIRMGMGMTDLEDEKRKLLEDYYAKNREADTLRDEKKRMDLEFREATEKVKELESELEKKSSALSDITTHPDYKAKVREAKRLEERLDEAETDLAGVKEKLDEFPADERKRLQGEVAFFKRKSSTIEQKLDRATERVAELTVEVDVARQAVANIPEPEPEVVGVTEEELEAKLAELKEQLGEDLEGIYEMFVQWRSNFTLFKTYLKELSGCVDALSGAEADVLPDALKAAVLETDPAEAMESVQDLLRVVSSDAQALRSGLNRFKKKLT